MNLKKLIESFSHDPQTVTLVSIGTITLTSQLHISRYLKKAALPVLALALAYRHKFSSDSESFVEIISKLVKDPAMRHFIGDVLGVIAISELINVFKKVLNINLSTLPKNIMDEIFSIIKEVVYHFLNYFFSSSMLM